MRGTWWTWAIGAAALGVAMADPSLAPSQDRVAALNQSLAQGSVTLQRDARTGYLRAVLDALGVPVESQLLVFSKTGVQRAYTSPKTPRAVYFDRSVAVAYVPGAPLIEIAADDPQRGMVFYTLDQSSASPSFARQTSCLSCHVSPATFGVPGLIARSHTVGDDGSVRPGTAARDVTHATRHPDRWGGWYVTSEDGAPPYSQLAHLGNITFSGKGNTSNQVFVDWMNSAPESRGYLLSTSDIAGLLVFDHQVHASNLLAKLNVESRQPAPAADVVQQLTRELADYLLFAGEAPPLSPLTPLPGFAANIAASAPRDHRGRSLGQLDLDRRLLKYPASFMIYSDAFDALPEPVQQMVYRRMLEVLSSDDPRPVDQRVTAEERQAVVEILRDTRPGFPQ